MKPRTLLFVAGAAFIISYFLPAYSGSKGLECFKFCWSLLWKYPGESPLKWLYYSGFVLTNIAFVIVFTLGLARSGFYKTRFIVTAVAFFHVLSWLLVNVRKEDITSIQAGYYLWLVAYVLLLASQISGSRKSKEA